MDTQAVNSKHRTTLTAIMSHNLTPMWILQLLILLTIGKCTVGQVPDRTKDVWIDGGVKSTLYIGKSNVLFISSKEHFVDSLVVKASQGTLGYDTGREHGHNILFWLDNLKGGKVTVGVYQSTKNGLQLLNKREFNVKKKPLTKEEKNTLEATVKPEISIEGYTDSIPISVLKMATKIDVNAAFKIKQLSFEVYHRKAEPHVIYEPAVVFLYSEQFDDNVKSILKHLKPNNMLGILIDKIKVLDLHGKVYKLKPINLKIVD